MKSPDPAYPTQKWIAIIPARYASTRFPGKPLADIRGKSMIERVYLQARQALEHVWVATDDQRIEQAVSRFGGHCVMTSAEHTSGTDRVREALDHIEQESGKHFQVVINLQGDEPFIQPEQLRELMSCFSAPETQIATLIKAIDQNNDIFNENLPKVVTDQDSHALYFSRSPIPFIRNQDKNQWIQHYPFMKHVGLYAYRTDILRQITRLAPSSLELAESLEQNRWIQNGYRIKTAITLHENHPVDTPGDLEAILQHPNQNFNG
ncbi:MAG: 3-deoxy-manno-octulosonate cytidylyltransferase [Bacteroidales bacterium]|nr:3-deoxy-manno-octulosonate cytidylyltransferase [Bacteroidales bacterium]